MSALHRAGAVVGSCHRFSSRLAVGCRSMIVRSRVPLYTTHTVCIRHVCEFATHTVCVGHVCEYTRHTFCGLSGIEFLRLFTKVASTAAVPTKHCHVASRILRHVSANQVCQDLEEGVGNVPASRRPASHVGCSTEEADYCPLWQSRI